MVKQEMVLYFAGNTAIIPILNDDPDPYIKPVETAMAWKIKELRFENAVFLTDNLIGYSIQPAKSNYMTRLLGIQDKLLENVEKQTDSFGDGESWKNG